MLTLPYTSRDYTTIFNGIKEIIQTLEPKADVDFDKANVESIIAKIMSGCVDSLSYNQDANILEAFPSTARDPRAVFDLLSIVGYTPKTARSCHLNLTLWNPSFTGSVTYKPFNSILLDNKTFYCPDEFKCTNGISVTTDWYQGILCSPDKRPQNTGETGTIIDDYYPNLSVNVIKNNQYKLPESHINIDSRTIRIYTEDGIKLSYVENPYMTNITKSSFSILPSVNTNGYSLVFSKDISSGNSGDNLYYFYVISEGYNIGANVIPDFIGLSIDGVKPSFSYNYSVEASHAPETAQEARENIVYEFGWRDTPKTIITTYDAERAVLQNYNIISAVCVKDGNNYSKCNPDKFDIQIFCKVNEDTELKLSTAVADSLKARLHTHFNKFKALPLEFKFHIDNIITETDENVTELYYWYPVVTIYLKEQVNSQEAGAILDEVYQTLFDKFSTKNINYNQVPRIVDVIDAIQNASDMILYLDINGIKYVDSKGNEVSKEDITCIYSQEITSTTEDYDITLETKNETRCIMYHTVKIFNSENELVAYDSGDGNIISNGVYLDGNGIIDYVTGALKFKLNSIIESSLYVSYQLETPTFCEFVNKDGAIKIALESLT